MRTGRSLPEITEDWSRDRGLDLGRSVLYPVCQLGWFQEES